MVLIHLNNYIVLQYTSMLTRFPYYEYEIKNISLIR